jgi:indolepyruvate ferredoxin oxidoreductase alpha subunit
MSPENAPALTRDAVASFLNETSPSMAPPLTSPKPALPVRPPVLCAGCPHRASFFAVKEAVKGSNRPFKTAVFSGDIGCYTLGNAQPLDMLDTCLCMGAGITIAQGLHRVEPDTLNFAFIGDSTFFHTGIPGIINAVYNNADIIVAILDNGTTAMTGGQPHPETGKTLTGDGPRISIHALVSALNVASLRQVNAFDLHEAKQAVEQAIEQKGVRVIIFEGPCITLAKKEAPCAVQAERCVNCALCVKKLGCPALVLSAHKVSIDAGLCTGCGLCKAVCPAKAIDRGASC